MGFHGGERRAAQIAESNAKARGIDAKACVNERYLMRLEDKVFVKEIGTNDSFV